MEQLEDNLEQWCRDIKTYHIPRWDELPDFDLYMDQVISYIEKCLGLPLNNDSNRIITPAMINNYTKSKMIPSPTNKKYGKKHLAYLIAITLLKQVITISEIKDGISYQFSLYGEKGAYDMFCEEQEIALRNVILHVLEVRQTEQANSEKAENLTLRMAAAAFSNKVIAEKVIKIQNKILAEKKASV